MNRTTRNSTESEAEIKDKKENLYWSAKLNELEVSLEFINSGHLMVIFKTYSAWDKQYILDTMLRDAVILLRPVEVKKLIEIGANINCNQFPQVKRLRILPRLYSTGIWSIRGRHPLSRTINLMVIKLDKDYFDIFSLSQAMRKNLYTATLWKQNQMK